MTDSPDSEAFAPPPLPPPLLSTAALQHLCRQGWIRIALPAHLLNSWTTLQHHTTNFFNHPSQDHKRSCYPPKQGTEFGYYLVEDEKEYLTLRCRTTGSSSSSELEAAAADFWAHAAQLLVRVLTADLSRYLRLPGTIWDDVLLPGSTPALAAAAMPTNEAQIRSGTLLRLFRYFPTKPEAVDINVETRHHDTAGGAGEHTDLGLLTLCIGSRGLECFDRQQQTYIDVLDASLPNDTFPPPAKTQHTSPNGDAIGAVLLLGQTIRGLTNHHLPAGIHRVQPPPETGRQSAVFALRHGYGDIDLRPWGLVGGAGDVPEVKARDFYSWLGVGKVNVNASDDLRRRQYEDLKKESGNADDSGVQDSV